MAGACGSCTLCCKVMGVRGEVRGVPLRKPRAGWCEHCDVGKGCKVYEDRPKNCVEFTCLWLACHEAGAPLPPEYRPDRSRVVLAPTSHPRALSAHMDWHRSNAWKTGPIWGLIQMLILDQGNEITLDYGDFAQTKVILYRDARGKIAAKKQKFSLPDDEGVQWATD